MVNRGHTFTLTLPVNRRCISPFFCRCSAASLRRSMHLWVAFGGIVLRHLHLGPILSVPPLYWTSCALLTASESLRLMASMYAS